jgi:hypothetical protein
MKKILTILLYYMACQLVYAGKVTENQARQKAQQFLKGKLLNEVSGARLKSPSQATDQQSFYVFNVENNGGYVIVSGDDRTKEILAYSERGNLDLAHAPENMKWWLSYYERAILSLGEQNYVRRSVNRESKKDVDVLISTSWNQESPFNNDCPEIGTGRCLTGCLATAMAQVMNFYQWPASVEEIPAYDPLTDYLFGPSQKALPATIFDWNIIARNDKRDSEFKQEVAKLCRYCGQSVRMGYATNNEGGSRALDGMGPVGLVKYFGYDKGTHNVFRGSFSDEDWEDMIYHELQCGRPVIYSGQTEAIYDGKPYGHTFICDGYKEFDGVGYYNINWGWGVSDTWCILSILDSGRISPFSEDQSAVIGIQPPTEENVANYTPLSITKLNLLMSPVLTRASLSEGFPPVYYSWVVKNSVVEATTAEVNFVLVRENIMAGNVPNSIVVKPGWNFSNSEAQMSLGPSTKDGVYRFYPRYKMKGESSGLKPVEGSNYRFIEITVEGLKMKLKVYPVEHLQGDANNDGIVSDADQYVIMEAIAAGVYDKNYDVNTDGKVTVADIVALYDILKDMNQ